MNPWAYIEQSIMAAITEDKPTNIALWYEMMEYDATWNRQTDKELESTTVKDCIGIETFNGLKVEEWYTQSIKSLEGAILCEYPHKYYIPDTAGENQNEVLCKIQ